MTETDDHSAWYFESRRKSLNSLIADLERLSKLPPVRRTFRTNIEMNFLLLRLADMVKMDNEMLESLAKSISSVQENIKNLASAIIGVMEKLSGRKEVEPLLKDIDLEKVMAELEELKQYKPTLEIMKSLAPILKDAIERQRRWLDENR